MLVARRRADVVRGDDPTNALADGPQDQHDPEPRQLVVADLHRRTAERLEDLLERVGVDRGGQAVADGRGPDRDAGLLAPGVGREVVGELGHEEDGVVGADRRGLGRLVAVAVRSGASRRAVAATRAPVACGSQSNVSVEPCELDRPDAGRQEVQERAEERGLADLPVLGGDDDRDAALDEDPQRRRQLRIERAGTQQFHDGTRRRWHVPDGDVAPRGRCHPSSDACGSHSKVSIAPSSSTVRTPGGRKSRSAPRSVDLPTCRASAATMTGTRPSMRTHSIAASSASSVPARSSSTMERGVGGTWRTAHRPRAGEVSAKGISERIRRWFPGSGRPAYGRPGSVKRFGARPRHQSSVPVRYLSLDGRFRHLPSRAMAARDPAADPERIADLATLFDQGGDPKWCWCSYFRVRGRDWTNATAGGNRELLETAARKRDHAPGLVAYDGRRGRRLGEPRSARGLRAAGLLQGPRPARRRPGLVDRVLRRRAEVARAGRRRRAARAPPSTTPATTARRCSRRTRSTSPRASGSPRRARSRARSAMFERAGFKVVARRQGSPNATPRPIVRDRSGLARR